MFWNLKQNSSKEIFPSELESTSEIILNKTINVVFAGNFFAWNCLFDSFLNEFGRDFSL